MREKVLRYIRERKLLRAGDRVAVAVSGGADSVALLRVLLELRSELGIVLAVAHFNHGLRGEASAADEAFVGELARQRDLEFFSGRGDVRDHALDSKLSVEAAARALRYQWFSLLAIEQRLDAIATGHTLDDQAETVLLKFLRGAGTRGLAGIYPEIHLASKQAAGVVSAAEADSCLETNGMDASPSTGSGEELWARTTRTRTASSTYAAPLYRGPARPASARIIRPLLAVTRDEVEHYLTSLGQTWREDESNLDHRFARNRVRHELLPLLEREYNPNIRQVLSDAAEVSRGEEEYWQVLVECEMERHLHLQLRDEKTEAPRGLKPVTLEASPVTAESGPLQSPGQQQLSLVNFRALPLALQRRLLKRWLESNQIAPDFEHVEKLRHCAVGELPKAELAGGWLAIRRGEYLELRAPRYEPPSCGYQYNLPVPGEIHITELGLTLRALPVPKRFAAEAEVSDTLLNADLLGLELTVRNWRPGDRFWPVHSKSEEKLKRLFSERHIPEEQRQGWPVVLCEAKIVWVKGFPVARAFAWSGTGGAVKIELLGNR